MPLENNNNASDDVFVLSGKVRVDQPEAGGFRTALDSVMVAAACRAKPGNRVLDLGCGVGAAGLCVLARVPGTELVGVDIQRELVQKAAENAALNGWQDRARFVTADILASDFIPLDGLVDHVVCNPPYLAAGTYTPSPDTGRATALGHLEPEQTLAGWIGAAHRCLKSRGGLALIHRADHIDEILACLTPRFGAVDIVPLWPRAGEKAKRIVVHAIKDRRGPPTLHAGIVLHEGDGWSAVAQRVLQDMAPLFSPRP